MKAMTTNFTSNQLIRCPNCKASITVEDLHEYVNAKPESKREAIKHEIEIWGLTHYDRLYYVENIVFCPFCVAISHLSDWVEIIENSRGGNNK